MGFIICYYTTLVCVCWGGGGAPVCEYAHMCEVYVCVLVDVSVWEYMCVNVFEVCARVCVCVDVLVFVLVCMCVYMCARVYFLVKVAHLHT